MLLNKPALGQVSFTPILRSISSPSTVRWTEAAMHVVVLSDKPRPSLTFKWYCLVCFPTRLSRVDYIIWDSWTWPSWKKRNQTFKKRHTHLFLIIIVILRYYKLFILISHFSLSWWFMNDTTFLIFTSADQW